MSVVGELLQRLEEETSALAAAVQTPNLEACHALVDSRERTLGELTTQISALRHDPADVPDLAAAIARLNGIQTKLVEAFAARRDATRDELARLREAKNAVTRRTHPEEESRFICKRV